MGHALYIGPRLGDWAIFEVSVLIINYIYIYIYRCQVSYPGFLHNSNSRLPVVATIDFSLIQAQFPIESEGGRLSG